MIDKELFKLIGKNKKYIFVALQVLGLIANVGITASICWAVYLVTVKAEPLTYLYPALCAVAGIVVRYTMTRLTGDIKDVLGRKVKKDLRERTYNKIVKLGVRSTDGMSMAGHTRNERRKRNAVGKNARGQKRKAHRLPNPRGQLHRNASA